jgi:signal recognition particle subunit SRP54
VSDFTLNDWRKQFEQLRQMGMKDVLNSMPGMSDVAPEGEDPEDALRHIQGMIDSMTKEERRNPDVIDISRRRRIATGSGTKPHEINELIDVFDKLRTVMRQMRWRSGL